MPDELGGFFFDVEKFLGSTAVRRMSMAELGTYVLMLCRQWLEPSRNLPDDAAAVADLITITPEQAAEVVTAWAVVRRKFVTSDHTPGRIWNIKLEDTRRKQRANLRKRRAAGRVAGKASAAKRLHTDDLIVNERSTIVERSSTDMNREDMSREEKSRSEEMRSEVNVASAPLPPVLVFPTSGKVPEWPLTDAQVAEWRELYPGVDIDAEARKALAWVKANGPKTARGMPAFLVNWLNRAVRHGGPRRVVSGSGLSETARYNLEASDEAERLILDAEARRTGTHGHHG